MDDVIVVITDSETTGLVPKKTVPGKRPGTTKKEQICYETEFDQYPYIVSLAWKINDQETQYYILNQEGREIPKEASDIHGITTEIANQSEYKFHDIITKFMDDCNHNDILVGQNIYYDTSIMKANVMRAIASGHLILRDYEIITGILDKYKRIDTMRACMGMMRGWAKLSAIHQKIFNKGFDAHDAKADVEAVHRIYAWLVKKSMVPTLEELKQKKAEKESSNG